MREILVGHTGFVGSNLNREHKFDMVFNSKNIEEAYGTNPDLQLKNLSQTKIQRKI